MIAKPVNDDDAHYSEYPPGMTLHPADGEPGPGPSLPGTWRWLEDKKCWVKEVNGQTTAVTTAPNATIEAQPPFSTPQPFRPLVPPVAGARVHTYQPSTSTGGTAANTMPAKSCHSGLYHIGDIGKAKIWAGREAAVDRSVLSNGPDFSLIVSLIEKTWNYSRDAKGEDFLVTGNEAAKALLPPGLFRKDRPIPFLHVNWPDFNSVCLGRDWWAEFNQALGKLEGDVVMYCMGGHGRTGTTMSILACLNGWAPRDQCPVDWLRKHYCKEVVESAEQIDYIEEITGRKVWAGGAKCFGAYQEKDLFANVTNLHKGLPKSPKPKVVDDDDDTEPTLSKNKYKKWASAMRRKGLQVEPQGLLADGAEVVVEGNLFTWNKLIKAFQYLEYVGDEYEDGIMVYDGTEDDDTARDESSSGPEMVS